MVDGNDMSLNTGAHRCPYLCQARGIAQCFVGKLRLSIDVAFWQILLQKSFWGDERKFLEPLMHLACGDVGDHIVSSKIDHGSSQRR
jgi:hypothetical protein